MQKKLRWGVRSTCPDSRESKQVFFFPSLVEGKECDFAIVLCVFLTSTAGVVFRVEVLPCLQVMDFSVDSLKLFAYVPCVPVLLLVCEKAWVLSCTHANCLTSHARDKYFYFLCSVFFFLSGVGSIRPHMLENVFF